MFRAGILGPVYKRWGFAFVGFLWVFACDFSCSFSHAWSRTRQPANSRAFLRRFFLFIYRAVPRRA